MKKGTSKYVATNIRTKESKILSALMERVIEKHSIKDIIECFLDKIHDWHDRDEVVQAILKDKLTKESLIEELSDEFSKDKFVVKFDTQDQEIQVKEFICSNIFPYYNQQQTALFC